MTAVLRQGRHRAARGCLSRRLLQPLADFAGAAASWLIWGWPVPPCARPALAVTIKPELPDPNYPPPRGGTLPGMQIPGYLARRH